MFRRVLFLLGFFVPLLPGPKARAIEGLTTPRAMGMADALRAAAIGSAGLHLNPSGMALVRAYSLEADYLFHGSDSVKDLEIGIVDSVTSRMAAGFSFNYLNADNDRSGYEIDLGFAAPIGDRLLLGITPVKYQSVGRLQQMGGPLTGGKADGFTVDIGATLRLLESLSAAVVGANLVAQHSIEAPREVTLGSALSLASMLQVGFDVVFDFDTAALIGKPDGVSERYHFGGELLLFERLALRSGYIRDTARDANFIAFGASVVSPQLAADFGGRAPVDGAGGGTLLGVSLRVFLQ